MNLPASDLEVFEVGVDANGQDDPNSKLRISFAEVFVVEGTLAFTKAPNGRVTVDGFNASVAINIPTGGGQLTEAIKLRAPCASPSAASSGSSCRTCA